MTDEAPSLGFDQLMNDDGAEIKMGYPALFQFMADAPGYSRENEWFGEPHILTVYELTLPEGPLDDGDLGDYDLQHPPSCKEEEHHHGYMRYTCAIADQEDDGGLAGTLKYSGTPVTKPGTYRIQAWGRKYWTELGDEHDNGVGVMDDQEDVSNAGKDC